MLQFQETLLSLEAFYRSGKFAQMEQVIRPLLIEEIEDRFKMYLLYWLAQALWRRGRAKEAEPPAREALSLAEHHEDSRLLGQILGCLGGIKVSLGEYRDAMVIFEQALDIHKSNNNKEGLGATYGNIGVVYKNLSDFAKALEYHKRSLAINVELGNKVNISHNYGNLGVVSVMLGQFADAVEYLQKSLSIDKELHKVDGVIHSYMTLGIIYRQVGDYSRAIETYQEAIKLCEEIDKQDEIASILGNIGIVFEGLGDYARALEYQRKALMLNEEMGRTMQLANNLSNIGVVYSLMKDYTRALEYQKRSLAFNQTIEREDAVAINLDRMGEAYHALGNFQKALDYFEQALSINRRISSSKYAVENLIHLAKVMIDPKSQLLDEQKAEEYLLEALELAQSMGLKEGEYEAHEVLSMLYKMQLDWEKSHYHLEKHFTIKEQLKSDASKKSSQMFDIERKNAEIDKQLAVEKATIEVMEEVLRKTFPSPLVPSLKSGKKVLVEKFASISVLFADIVGFTELATKIEPDTLIEVLNHVFTGFDTAIKKHLGHRLRTIGDGYFAICGAPNPVSHHQRHTAKAALEMIDTLRVPQELQENLPSDFDLQIRVGLHCGPAVCGMVGGLEKWQYDAYGDTINVAKRLETYGHQGKVHCSEEFRTALASCNEFSFEQREPIAIKGKGVMQTFFLRQEQEINDS